MMTLKDGKRFNDTAAYAACKAAEAQYKQAANLGSVAWNSVYSTEAELIDDLKKVYIPQGRGPMGHCFQGYAYIYAFAFYVQKGWQLSPKQMTQAKRLAVEIKKAAIASEYVTDKEAE